MMPRGKRAKRSPSAKSRWTCPHAAYMHAINSAPISNQARHVAGQIALNLEEISRLMRDERRGFYEALRACAFPDEYFPPLMAECLDAGLLKPDTIGELPALLPRLPDGGRPC